MGLCSEADVSHMIENEGRPLPNADGTDKRGLWHFRPNGSGTWTRVVPSATTYTPLGLAGPYREEVVSRTTYCAITGMPIGPVMLDYATTRFTAEPLPEPTPRAIRTVLAFHRTAKHVPPECRYTLS